MKPRAVPGAVYFIIVTLSLFGVFPGVGVAELLQFKSGEVTVSGRITGSVQQAVYDDPTTAEGVQTGTEFDGSARLVAEWLTPDFNRVGFRLEYDRGDHYAEELQRDEVYLYVVNEHGRLELGEQDGPADRLSFHAPVIGLGQVRGDFVRYAGRQALLSPYDTRDAAKVIYLAPPTHGFRYGLSYAPEFSRNASAADPRDRSIQNNAIEVGAQYVVPFDGWVWGASGAYVSAQSASETERADIDSWSLGMEWRRKNWVVGGAYVWRGDSNLRTQGYDQWEYNGGIAWRSRRWGAAASLSTTSSITRTSTLFGAGGYYRLASQLYLRGDLVKIEESPSGDPRRGGWVAMTELELRIE